MGLEKRFDFRPGQTLGASDLNRMQRGLESVSKITATPPIKVSTGPFGTNISLALPDYKKIGKADADIAARSGATPGSGTVSIWMLQSNGTLTDSGIDYTGYNLSSSAVTSGSYIMLAYIDGNWWIDFEDCS